MHLLDIRHQIKEVRWKGFNASGKKCKGRFIALSSEQAIAHLTQQQLIITKMKNRRLSYLEYLSQRVTHNDIQLLISQMATMLSCGLPVIRAIDLTLSQARKAGMFVLLNNLNQQVANGTTMAQALASSHPGFKGLTYELIHAGEISGQLAEAFTRLAHYGEKQQQIRAKVKKAAIYPSVVLTISLILAYIMLTYIIPQFEHMFRELGAELPWFTQIVLNLSSFLEHMGIWLFILLGILGVALKSSYRKSSYFRFVCAKLNTWLPAIGVITKQAIIARFCQTLAAAYRSGIPILTAIDSAVRTTNNPIFERSLSQLSQQVSSGLPLFQALRQTELFPDIVIQLIMIGEESGNLDEALDKVANFYEQGVDNHVDNLEKLLEPLVILALGLIVGSLVIAMYLPIFNLMNVLG